MYNPNDFDRVFVSFSGGKDSVASFIKVKELFPLHKIVLIFTDTGHEMPETYAYLKWFDENVFPVVRLTQKVTPGKRRVLDNTVLSWDVSIEEFEEMGVLTIFDEIRNRHTSNSSVPPWPSSGLRYCTRALKINPFFKYIRGLVPKDQRSRILIVRGLRAQESNNRKDTQEYVVDEVNGDFYTFFHPVYNLSTEEVFELHRQHNIKINPVYEIRERSNCVGCPFARNKEIVDTLKVYPDIMDEYIEIENETGYSWKNKTSLKQLKMDNKAEVVQEELEEDLSCTSGYCDI